MDNRRFVRNVAAAMLAYALLSALYVWWTGHYEVPAAVRGTAADPATFYSSGQLARMRHYVPIMNWLYLVSLPWDWAFYIVLLRCGVSRSWRERLDAKVPQPWLRLPLFVLLLNAATFLAFLPIRLTGYAVNRHFGISTQPFLGWLRDKAVSFGIGYVTTLAVTAAAFWFIKRGGRWWVKLWLLSVPFTMFMMYVQPVVIDPLYNRFDRLSNPQLEAKILDLAAKADIPARRVYEVHVSDKTNALNAYVNGIGSTLRIVLWDTTLKKLSEDEILFIMAHEMGHYVMHHLEWSAAGAVGSSFVLLAIGSKLYRFSIRRWGKRLGIRGTSDLSALPLLMLIVSLLSFVVMPFQSAVSRRAEHAADVYGLSLTKNPDAAIRAFQKLAATSLDDVNPPAVMYWLSASHPSMMERIQYVQSYKPQP